MYFAANGIPIAADYTANATFPAQGAFPRGYFRLDVFALGTDAIVQWLELNDVAVGGWQNDVTQEVVLPMGFHSIPVLTPFSAIRFRVWEFTQLPPTGSVHVRLLA